MTGRTVWHLPIGPKNRKNFEPGQHCPDDIVEHCLAEVFNRAGYDTMRTCKKGNCYRGANKRFQVVKDATKRGGTAELKWLRSTDEFKAILPDLRTAWNSDR